jgi:hypothetical protein
VSDFPRLLAGPRLERAHTLFCVSRPFLDGGPQKRLFRLARAWAARGYPTAVAALRGDLHADPAEFERTGLSVYLMTGGGAEVLKSFKLEAARAVRRRARSQRPRLVCNMETIAD